MSEVKVEAQIYLFPLQRICNRCVHFDDDRPIYGYCQLLDKIVRDVEIAEDCNSFEAEN